MGGGKCRVCGKKLNNQNRKYISNVFCTAKCRVKHWADHYGRNRLKMRDRVVDEILGEYFSTLKKGNTAGPSRG